VSLHIIFSARRPVQGAWHDGAPSCAQALPQPASSTIRRTGRPPVCLAMPDASAPTCGCGDRYRRLNGRSGGQVIEEIASAQKGKPRRRRHLSTQLNRPAARCAAPAGRRHHALAMQSFVQRRHSVSHWTALRSRFRWSGAASCCVKHRAASPRPQEEGRLHRERDGPRENKASTNRPCMAPANTEGAADRVLAKHPPVCSA
jgi:hypothetical protein